MTEENLGILTNIKVEGFKSIKKMDLPLKPLNVIVGPNGVGKSNFIGVFKLLYNIVNQNLQAYIAQNGGAERFLCLGSKNTSEILVNLAFKCNTYQAALITSLPDTLMFRNEKVCYYNDCTELTFNGPETFLYMQNMYRIKYTREYLHGFRVYHFHDTGDTALIKKTGSVSNQIYLQEKGENLTAMLYRYKEHYSEDYMKIVKTIQMVAPFFQDFLLEPDDNQNIMLKWKHRGSDAVFDASYLSDGTIRFIALVTLLLQPKDFIPSTVLIDEPELGLHPYALKILAELMKAVSKNGKQIIVTSQSVTFINEFNYDDIVIVDRKDNESTFRRLEEQEVKSWLDEFSLGDIWERNIIGGNPNDF